MVRDFYGGPEDRVMAVRVLESAADTFTQVTVDLPVNEGQNKAVLINSIEFIPNTIFTMKDEDSGWIQVTEKTKTAIKLYDEDVVACYAFIAAAVTTGFNVLQFPFVYKVKYPRIVAKDKLFFGIKGNSNQAALDFTVRVHYQTRKIPERKFINRRKW